MSGLVLFPILAALAQAASLIFHKIGLTRRRIDMGVYLPLLFLYLSIYSVATLPFIGSVNVGTVVLQENILLLLAVCLTAVVWNYLYFLAIKAEKVNAVENVINLGPVATIVIAWLVTPALFDIRVAVAASLATVVLVWGYWEKKRLAVNRYTLLLGFSVLLAAVESILIAKVLQAGILSPATLFALRVIVMWLFFTLQFRPSYKKIKPHTKMFIGLNALLSLVMMLLRFYALRDSGVIYTSLVLILVPIIVYFGSAKYLHEKLKAKQLLSAAALLGVIMYATYLKL